MKIEVVGKDVVTATEELLTIQGLEGSFSVGWVKERNPKITNQVMDNAKIFFCFFDCAKVLGFLLSTQPTDRRSHCKSCFGHCFSHLG